MRAERSNNRIEELEREIDKLPVGSIAKKKIKGSTYFYHRISVDGKRHEIYVSPEEATALREGIEKRKQLECQLREERTAYISEQASQRKSLGSVKIETFRTYVRVGENLQSFSGAAGKLRRRNCFYSVKDYLADEASEKVLILYGLRRTGKTTIIRQLIADMSPEELDKTIFIQIKATDTLADLNSDLKLSEELGYKYIFIDEATLLKDFIQGAALLSDIFAASGMKIVLTGTDSLGFVFSEDEQLYDRCILVHTTFIPYGEFERVLGIKGIDEYIRYGGTMCLGNHKYNDHIFADKKQTDEYIDSAIARNIQHSLAYYQDGGHFMKLQGLYERGELTSAINRVVEDMNHRFAVETLVRQFHSNDLSLSARNIRVKPIEGNDILDRIDLGSVTAKIKNALDILNAEEQGVRIEDEHASEIKEYLKLLDLVVDIEVKHIPGGRCAQYLPVISQPGLRYVQAEVLVQSLLEDAAFDELDIMTKNVILELIRDEIKGRMMEELVLLETKLACPDKNVFKLQFAVGEFDMVVADPETLTCRIYEIKHSDKRVEGQCRHLRDEEKCHLTEHHFGEITGKCVIYRGERFGEKDIEYINVEEYLKNLQELR